MFKNKFLIFLKLRAFVAEGNEYNYRWTIIIWHQVMFEGRLCRNAWHAHSPTQGWKWDGLRRFGLQAIPNKLITVPAKRILSERIPPLSSNHKWKKMLTWNYSCIPYYFVYKFKTFTFVSSFCRRLSVQDSHQHDVVITDDIVCASSLAQGQSISINSSTICQLSRWWDKRASKERRLRFNFLTYWRVRNVAYLCEERGGR